MATYTDQQQRELDQASGAEMDKRAEWIAAKIQFFDDERAIGNSIIVTLVCGWKFPGIDAEHVRGFDHRSEALAAVKRAERCSCDECRRHAKLGA